MKWITRVLTILMTAAAFAFVMPGYTALAKETTPIDKLVELPAGKYDTIEANAMIDRLNKIPANLLEGLVDKGIKVILTSDIITSVPELSNLKGVTPRGWEKTGLTWDDVPGVSTKNVIVRIGYSAKGKGHNSFNLEIHETLHAIDRFVLGGASDTDEFKAIFNKEANVNYKGDGYVSVYPVEYFAEAASLYLFDDATKAGLKKATPLTYDYLEKLFAS